MLNSKATVCSLKVLQKCIFWKQNLPFCSQSRVLGFEACHVKIKPLYHHEMTWSQRTHGRREITFKTFTPGACLPVQAQLAALTVSALLKGIMTVVMKRRGTALMRVNSYQRSTVTEKKQEGGVAAAASRWVCVRVCVWACVYCLQFTQQHTGRASKPCCFLLWGKHNPQPWGRARTNSGAPGGRPSSMIPWRRSRPPGGRLLDPEISNVTNSLYTYLYM